MRSKGEPGMTRVLIASDDSDQAVRAATTAHTLFGEAADYFVINVGSLALPYIGTGGWGIAAPISLPITMDSGTLTGRATDEEIGDEAHQRAVDVASEAALSDAEAIGEVGDPATAILDAAHERKIDVIVVGSHRHHWFDALFSGSVSRELIRESDIPVLVVT
jgi:nucleotide-binding universal stress UspA family protein